MKKQSIGICKFCGQEKKLIDAHIIPKNFYLMREKDRYLSINSKTCKYTIQQKGGYDFTVVCFGEHNIVYCVAPNGEKYVFDKDFLIDPDK